MKRYVLGFYFSNDLNDVVLIQKARPETQAGKWNGLGGGVREGESDLAAMTREFKEESGLTVTEWVKVGTLQRNGEPVIVFAAKGSIYEASQQTDEKVRPWGLLTVAGLKIPVVSNLPMLLFMAKSMMAGVDTALEYNLFEVAW